jgi:hypothetical protein
MNIIQSIPEIHKFTRPLKEVVTSSTVFWHMDISHIEQHSYIKSQDKPSFTTSIVRALFRAHYVHNMFRLLPKAIFRLYYITQNI